MASVGGEAVAEESRAGNPSDPSVSPIRDRAYERHDWKHWVHVCWIRDSTIGDPLVVATTDLSAGGVGLICPNMVHAGAIGLVMLMGAQPQVMVRYIVVRHCRYMMDVMSHLVGARWIPQPAGMPEVRAEMRANGPCIVVGPSRHPRDARTRRRAAAIVTREPRGPQSKGHH